MNKRNVLMYAGGGGSPAEPASIHYAPSVCTKSRAFTMAEILLSLTIIGVVAAITLPSLTGNINERTWNTQRKALYARFSQAMALMPALNGFGTLEDGDPNNVAETFVTSGLSKVLKINNICDADHLADCGITSKIAPLGGGSTFSLPTMLSEYNDAFNGTFCTSGADDNGPDGSYTYSQVDTKVAAFETANGESIAIYYNPACTNNSSDGDTYFTQPDMCANFIYDLNGTKGPNTVGKDIGFISAIYPSDSVVVAPIPNVNTLGTLKYVDAVSACKNNNIESRLPNKDELASMFYNKKLFAENIEFDAFLSSTRASSAKYPAGVRILYFSTGRMHTYWLGAVVQTWCVLR